MTTLFIQSTRAGKEAIRFEIKSFDPVTKMGVIRGSMGVDFPTNLSKEHLLEQGYKVVKVEE